jgi:hypothetical protein
MYLRSSRVAFAVILDLWSENVIGVLYREIYWEWRASGRTLTIAMGTLNKTVIIQIPRSIHLEYSYRNANAVKKSTKLLPLIHRSPRSMHNLPASNILVIHLPLQA